MSSDKIKGHKDDRSKQPKYYGGSMMVPKGEPMSVLKFLQEQEAYHMDRIAWHKKQLEECDFLIRVHKEQYNEEDSDPGLVISDLKPKYLTASGAILPEESNNDRSSWKKIAVKVIEGQDCLLSSNEIIDFSGVILSPGARRNARVYLSIGLKELVEEGLIKRYNKQGVKGYYYGLPYMFDGERPKDKFFSNIK